MQEIPNKAKISDMEICFHVQPFTVKILYLTSMLIHHMKSCIILGFPAYSICKGLSSNFRRDDFPQIHL